MKKRRKNILHEVVDPNNNSKEVNIPASPVQARSNHAAEQNRKLAASFIFVLSKNSLLVFDRLSEVRICTILHLFIAKNKKSILQLLQIGTSLIDLDW